MLACNRRARTLGDAIRPVVERLESRRLLAGFEILGRTLTYISNDTPQLVRVRAEADTLRVTADGRTRTLARSLVHSIHIVTGDGADDIRITAGLPAEIQSGGGNDLIWAVTRGAKSINAGLGDDTVRSGSDNDLLAGGEGDDCLLAADGNDTLVGGGGRDKLYGQNGEDHLEGNADADRLLGGDGRDTLTGNGGNDLIDTGPGSDLATGGAGADKLFAVDGDDTLRGGLGDDTLYAGPGQEDLRGDEGVDRLSYHYGGGGVNVAAGQPIGGWSNGDSIDAFESLEVAQSAATLSGSSAGETLLGNSGDDSFGASGGDDLLDGATGDDIATFTGAWRDYAITESNGVFELLDERVGSPDGHDVVRNVERFAFQDGNLFAGELLNVAPVVLQSNGGNVDENAFTGTAVSVFGGSDANVLDSVALSLIDDAGGRFSFHAGSGQLRVVDPMLLNFEAQNAHVVTLRATDVRGLTQETDFTISINDVNEAPALAITTLVSSLQEDVDTATAIAVAELSILDDALGAAEFSLIGTHAAMFEIVDARLRLIAGAALDFETIAELELIVGVDDPTVGGLPDDSASFSVSVGDVNEAPTGGSLSASSVNENAANGTSIATITGVDVDAGDALSYTLVDDAAGRFAISGAGLLSVADGALLDFETATSHDITVRVSDAAGLFIDLSFTITLNNIAGANYSGTSGGDTYSGGLEPDTINGNNGNDSLAGGGGNDTIDGGGGNDTVSGDSGNDSLIGGSGADWAYYSSSSSSVNVNLSTGTATGQGTDSLATIENVRGSSFADTLTGSSAGNFLDGWAGDDSLNAGNGNDSMRGGSGNDTLNGGAGAETVYYDTDTAGVSVNLTAGTATQVDGVDMLISIETLSLSAFADTVVGSSAATTIFDNAGNDSIDGGGGNDTLYAMGGDDTLAGGTGTDRIDFNSALGSITASLASGAASSSNVADGTDSFSGFEQMRGSNAGSDSLTGSSAANTLLGSGGNDTLIGGGGNDSLSGDGGASDVAVFTGNWANYTITVSGANYQLIDTRSGSPDGTDLVSNTTERFQFANGTILAAELINVAPSISGISSSTVPELSATGTVVGTVSASDANSLDTRTFALSDDAGGRFQIDASSGVVSVLDGLLLVISIQPTHSITVTVTDAFGLTASASFTITLTL